jgi:prephenate dehydratase
MSITVGFLGSDGSFTNKAASNFFGRIPFSSQIDYHANPSSKVIFEQVGNGTLSYGVVPVESSNHGTLPMYLESLLNYSENIRIVVETIEREYHCLCAPSNVVESSITRIISHPIILEDCSIFINALSTRFGNSIEVCGSNDSAAACKELNTSGDGHTAVICTREAASLYGLKVLSQSVGNDRNSETRYIVIANFSIDPLNIASQSRSSNDKVRASIILLIKNTFGSFFKMILCFGLRDINILKIESRPSSAAIGLKGNVGSVFRHWDMIFFIDYEVSDNEETAAALLANLGEYCDWIRTLGEYKQFSQQYATVTEIADWNTMLDILATA